MQTTETTHLQGNPVHLSGDLLKVGDNAPEVTLINADLQEVTIGGKGIKVQLFIVVPSLDTDVCARETREFNVMLSTLDIVESTVISMDLPFASKRFCTLDGIDNVTAVSDYIDKDFGKKYGVLMSDGGLKGMLARSIFVVNEDGVISYKEILDEVTSEPDYEKVLEAVKDARL